MPEMLSPDQIAFYGVQGYLILENQVPLAVIEDLRAEVARFEAEAKGMTASNGRLDLEDSHRPDAPRVRRIKRPDLISPVAQALMVSDHILGPVRDLLGPNLRLHTTKLNMKSAGFGAPVEWHQDFAFYPHTNDDLLAVGVTLDDMGLENGPLQVFPSSHLGPIHDHHRDGVFAGAMLPGEVGLDPAQAVALTGPVGAVTLHHARIVHGSAPNVSDRSRRILFIEVAAADAFPVMGAMTEFGSLEGYNAKMLCGTPSLTPRLRDVPVRIPQPQPTDNRSIYEIQKTLGTSAFE